MPVELETQPLLDDTILNDLPTPLRAVFFPLGFPVEIATNREAVLDAAHQAWGMFSAEYDEKPLSLNLIVTEHENEWTPSQSKFRCHGHLMSIVIDARNHVICDLSQGCASGWVTSAAAEHPEFLWLRFLEPPVMSMLVAAHLATIHGALVARNGIGVALCGNTFAGKSTLAYACARSGWTFIADDGIFLTRKRTDRFAVGNPHSLRLRPDAKNLFPELAEFPVALRPNGKLGMEVPTSRLPVSTAAGCSIDHVVFLNRSGSSRGRVSRCDRSDALRRLETATLYGPPEVQTAQSQTYRRLLDAGTWEMYYSDLDDAIALLDRLK